MIMHNPKLLNFANILLEAIIGSIVYMLLSSFLSNKDAEDTHQEIDPSLFQGPIPIEQIQETKPQLIDTLEINYDK